MSEEILERIEKQMEGSNLALAAVADVLAKMDNRLSKADQEEEIVEEMAEGGEVASVLPKGTEADYRGGGVIPVGSRERADDVPARLSKNEFVMTADAVRAAGGGSINKGAKRMYNLMNNLEARV